MKKRKIILLIIAVIFIITGIVAYLILGNNTELSKEKENADQTYECKFIINDNFELNTFKENHTYEIVVNNNAIKKVNIYKNFYFNDKESFDRVYSIYNSENADGYKTTGFDFDSKTLSIEKEEKTKLSYLAYLKANNIDAQYCKLKETSNKSAKEHKSNTTDTTYICKNNNLITYITVDSKKTITSIYNGTIHKITSLEEFNQIKSALKENDVLKYIFDEANLNIIQLNKMFIYEDMNYDDYVKGSLSGYNCELSNE